MSEVKCWGSGFSRCEMLAEKRCHIALENWEDTLGWLALAAECLGNLPCLSGVLFVKAR